MSKIAPRGRSDRSIRSERLALDVDREISSEAFTAATDKGRGDSGNEQHASTGLMHRIRCPENDCDRYGEGGAHVG